MSSWMFMLSITIGKVLSHVALPVTRNGSLLGIPINNQSSFSSVCYSNNFGLLVCKLFHVPILKMDRSITTFGSILAFFTLSSSRCSEPTLHPSQPSGNFPRSPTFLIRHDLGIQISPSKALRHVMFSTNSFVSLLLRSLASAPRYQSNTSLM